MLFNKADFKAKPLNLYRNFRSEPQLLRMQNKIIEVLDPAAVMADDMIKGDGGEIYVEAFDDDQQEAEVLAAHIDQWVTGEASSPSEIAVLVPRLVEQYCGALMSELRGRGLPYRNEQQLQDLSVEPLARLIIDYLLVLFGSREPAAYTRLLEQLTGASYDEDEYATFETHGRHFCSPRSIKSLNRKAQAPLLFGIMHRNF